MVKKEIYDWLFTSTWTAASFLHFLFYCESDPDRSTEGWLCGFCCPISLSCLGLYRSWRPVECSREGVMDPCLPLSSSSLSFSVSGRMRSKNMPPRWLCNPGQAVSPLCGLVATLVKGDHTVELSLANEQAVGISVSPLWHPLPQRADAICGHQSRPWSSQEDAARPGSVLRAPGGCEEGWRSLWGTDRAEELCSLLQEAHQPTLGEVATRAHPVLIRWQGVIRDCRLLKHIGGNIL